MAEMYIFYSILPVCHVIRFVSNHNSVSSIISLYKVLFFRPDHDQQHCYYHAPTVKPGLATAVVELLIMGVRTPETC
jgi:hypothetical protein